MMVLKHNLIGKFFSLTNKLGGKMFSFTYNKNKKRKTMIMTLYAKRRKYHQTMKENSVVMLFVGVIKFKFVKV